ncbi:MAG TPA: FAD-dependent oxidoreductase [Candidatus Limiplasma sp.]|nr:FAD-dependent oxidoreductase [Candidatus Limiplasma sp.]HRX09247.1 FAD-dependent oxidoreductase [Candidatus Limiplasma sp.]
MAKNIVILGGGYAGVIAAKKLEKKLKGLQKKQKIGEVTITLIDRNPFHTMLTELHEVAAARVEEESIKLSFAKIFAGRKVQVVMDKIDDINFETKTLTGAAGQTYSYDYLVLAAGSKPTFFGVKGASQYAYKLWSYQDAVVLKERILHCFREASRETDPEKRKKLLTFFTVGAGFTGTEMAGELAEWIPILCHQFEIKREEVTLYMADLLDRVVPTMPNKYCNRCHGRLTKMGVTIMLKNNVVEIGKDFIVLQEGDVQQRIESATIIWAAGTDGASIAQKAAKTLPGTRRARLESDKFLRSKTDTSVYLVGDVLHYVPEGEEAPVPQVVENAEYSAECAAHNILVELTGEGEMEAYSPKLHGVMVCVGGRWGSAYVGTHKHKFGLPSFLAMFSKHFINMFYFAKVMGWTKIISYMKHEFFTIRNHRSFVGGHFSNVTPSFLLVPLRLWLGAVWVFEAVMKIVEGWFGAAKLSAFFGGANAWFDSLLGVANKTVEAVSSATGAAEAAAETVASASGTAEAVATTAGHVLINFDFLNIFQLILVSGKELAQSALGDFAVKLNIPIMNWLLEHTVLTSDGLQIFMQVMIVLMELAVGLALMGGLLTAPASATSLVLQFMFITTTGLYLNTLWMLFASVACLIGAGRTLGLDYYAMPWAKRHWKNIRWIKKWYLYND